MKRWLRIGSVAAFIGAASALAAAAAGGITEPTGIATVVAVGATFVAVLDGLAFCSDCGLPYGTQRT